ncbi:MAG TPA: VIT domain-containing protein, partial [Kofleriaceae bacterium]|nr:VIT domain-containing protein [Kofleriaceae bacterium]
MVRPAFVFAVLVVLTAGVRAANDLPPRMGMYPAQGAPLSMLDSKIAVHVRGPIAESIVSQTFRNDTDRATEATYIFPLPADAAVSAMEIETGARTIRASIETREQAQQRYERAVSEGVGAGLLDQERPDVFTQTVSAIPAHSTVTVTLRFDTVARYQGGRWELVLPLVVAPRYVPGTASGRPTTGSGRAPDTDRAPDASRVTPGGAPGAGGSTEVTLDFVDVVDDVASPTHELANQKGTYRFVDAKSDHDAVIRWRAKAPAAGWVESDDGGGFAAIVVEAKPAPARTAAVKLTLVLDRSATTRGDADATKKPLVRALLTNLSAKDRVGVAGSEKLDAKAPDQIWKALEETWGASHGALDLAKVLAATRTQDPLVLVSDGLVADDHAVIAAAAKVGAPIHVIGIGPAPNRSLLSAIATTTGGTIRFAAIGDDVSALARDVLADVASPPESLSINWGTLAASDMVPATLPRVGSGQAILVLARVKRVQTANARVRGDVFGFTAVTPSKAPDGATTTKGALARRWAKLRLDDLIAAGTQKPIVEHALRFGLVSPYTSMVAIGDEVVVQGGVKHSVAVPVSVPAGMQWQHVKREVTVDTSKAGTKQQEQTKLEEDRRDSKKTKPKKDVAEHDEPRAGEAETSAPDTSTIDKEADEEPARKLSRDETENLPAPASPVAMGADSGASYDEEEAVLTSEYAPLHRRLRYGFSFGAG